MTFPSTRPIVALGGVCALVLLVASCDDTPLSPRLTPPSVRPMPMSLSADAVESPVTASADFSVSGTDPLPGQQQELGYYPTTTVVSVSMHQSINLRSNDPEGGSSTMGLGGRLIGNGGCSHYGEAYLAQYAFNSYSFPLEGCNLPDPTATSFSTTIPVEGYLVYGMSGDSSCPPPAEACSTYGGSSGITINRLPATLDASMDPNGGSLGAARYYQGFTFRFRAVPEQLNGFQTPVSIATDIGGGMAWTPAGASEPNSQSCQFYTSGGELICSLSFSESGTLKFVVFVNGARYVGGPYSVTVVPPKVTLAASSTSVVRGDTVVLTATIEGADSTDITGYSFRQDDTGGGGGGDLSIGVRGDAVALTPVSDRGPSLTSASAADLPSCRPGVLKCWVTPTKSGTFTVDARLGRVEVSADVHIAVTIPDSGTVVFDEADEDGGGTPTATASMKVHAAEATNEVSTAAAKANDYFADIRPSETIGIGVDSVFTKKFRVRVLDLQGQPMHNAAVHLKLRAHEGTGGHDHIDRTNLPKNPGSIRKGNGAWRDSLQLNTKESGEAIFEYRSPDAGGPISLRGTSPHSAPARLQIDVADKTLVHIKETKDTLEYVGKRGTHPDPFWVTKKQRKMLYALADTLVKRFTKEKLPKSAIRWLGVNDASLQYGGILDISGKWRPPHHDHRRGFGTDVRTNDKTPEQTRFMEAYWSFVLGGGVYDEREPPKNPEDNTGPHYHFKECKEEICRR